MLLAALEQIGAIVGLRVEDAPASRADAGYAFIANEIFVRFRLETRDANVTRFGSCHGAGVSTCR